MRAHFPNVTAIRAVEQDDIRFYAIVGACVSLVSAVEFGLFECYVAATGQAEKDAAIVFYRFNQYTHKRDVVDGAIRAIPNPSIAKQWDKLLIIVQSLLGPDGPRNLLAHNFISGDALVTFDDDTKQVGVQIQFSTEQNAAQIAAGTRSKRSEDFESLATFASRLVGVRISLRKFNSRLRVACGRPLPLDERALAMKRRRGRTKTKLHPQPPFEP